MRIGVDFDNTLVAYDRIIRKAAIVRGLLPKSFHGPSKQLQRDAIRRLPNGDLEWQKLQSFIYAEGIEDADEPEGLDTLLSFTLTPGVETWIVSHKTETAPFDTAKRSLRDAALAWMERHGFFDPQKSGIRRDHVIFTATKDAKIQTIADLRLSAFVDDLEEILLDPRFPDTTKRIHFSSTVSSSGQLTNAKTLDTVSSLLFDELSSAKLSSTLRLLGHKGADAEPAVGGRNSRSFRVRFTDGSAPVFIKQYFARASDTRDRLGTEYGAVKLMAEGGIGCVPRPFLCDRNNQSAVYEYVEGRPALQGPISSSDIDALLSLLSSLHRLAQTPLARSFKAASEAYFSPQRLFDNLMARRDRLSSAPDAALQHFLKTEYDPALACMRQSVPQALSAMGLGWKNELPPEFRTLSPSDIGFHNVLRQTDGRLCFVDFEYFGWDDPAKLVSDFLLQPEQNLRDAERERFVSGACSIYPEPTLRKRLPVYAAIFRLKWVLILLNEFSQMDRARRQFALSLNTDMEASKARQLAKAKLMISPLLQKPSNPKLACQPLADFAAAAPFGMQ